MVCIRRKQVFLTYARKDYSKDRLLLLDGGGIYQGASISNLLDGKPLYMAMDRMDYDAVSLGNHEFDGGLQAFSEHGFGEGLI